jgi:hypothetical protein
MAPVIGLPAVVAMILDGFAQFVLGMRDAAPAIIVIRGLRGGSPSKEKETTQGRRSECGLAKHRFANQRLAKQRRMQMLTQKHKRPPEGAALVWFGVCASLQVKPARRKNVAQEISSSETDGTKIEAAARDEEKGAAACAAPAEI